MVQILSVLFLISLIFGNVLRIQITDTIAITFPDIISGVIAITTIIQLVFQKVTYHKNPLFIPFLLFVGVCILSLVVNSYHYEQDELIVSFLYILRYFTYGSILFFVSKLRREVKEKLMHFLLFVGSTLVILGFFQYGLYQNLRNLYYLGWDEHMYRMFSTFLDPNFIAVIFIAFFILSISLLTFKVIKSRFYQIMLMVLSLLTIVAILLTYSRSGIIMLGVSVFVFLYLVKKIKWIPLFLFVMLGIYIIIPNDMKIENLNLLRTASSQARLETTRNALAIFWANPIFGVGFNAYRYAQIDYGFRSENTEFVSHADSGSDNSFLFVLATSGIVGFCSFLFLVYSILKSVYRQIQNAKGYYTRAISVATFSICIGICVNALFINSLFYTFILGWVWVMVGLSVKENT